MKRIKRKLYRWLGRERYLFLVSQLYFIAYRTGLLRSDPDYACHYFVRHLIQRGDYVIDIGANLGYYSVLFADWVGSTGRVWSVEPVPLYREILQRNLGGRAQVSVVPYALGEETNVVRMGIPGDQPFRHGLTRILERGETEGVAQTFEVRVRPPIEIFGDLDRLDYIKCDVEGYEIHVIPQMQALIREFRPIVQVELAAENRASIFRLFEKESYLAACVRDHHLQLLRDAGQPSRGDVIFLPRERQEEFERIF